MWGSSLTLTKQKSLLLLLLSLILWLGFATRTHQIGEQSLWYDEGLSIGHTVRNPLEIIDALQADVHLPGYFIVLTLWEDLTGNSEFALRYLSVMFSLVTIAFSYALGRRLFNPLAGVIAALFVALNTFGIYYAQEARMYVPLATLNTVSMWAFVGFVYAAEKNLNKKMLIYGALFGVINGLAIYFQVVTALTMITQGLLFLLWLIPMAYEARQDQNWRRVGRFLGTYILFNIITLLIFAPYAKLAIERTFSQPNISDVLPLQETMEIIQGWLSIGVTYVESIGGLGVVIYMLLLFGLLVLPGQQQRKRAWWQMLVPVVWVLVSVSFYLYLELTTRYTRFLLPAQIGAALWMARGVWVLWSIQPPDRQPLVKSIPRLASIVSLLLVVFMMLRGLDPLYNSDDYKRDDYRGLITYIEQQMGPNDALIVNPMGLRDIVGYYYTADQPMYLLSSASDDVGRIAQTEAVIAAGHDHYFMIMYGAAEQDPNGIIEATLNQELFQVQNRWWDNLKLLEYVRPADLGEATTSDLVFELGDDTIELVDYALPQEATFRAGDSFQIAFHWRTPAPIEKRYKLFLHLINETGELVAQRDIEPDGGLQITSHWPVQEPIQDRHALRLPDDLAAGDYQVRIGWYDFEDSSNRMQVEGDDYVPIANIQIQN